MAAVIGVARVVMVSIVAMVMSRTVRVSIGGVVAVWAIVPVGDRIDARGEPVGRGAEQRAIVVEAAVFIICEVVAAVEAGALFVTPAHPTNQRGHGQCDCSTHHDREEDPHA